MKLVRVSESHFIDVESVVGVYSAEYLVTEKLAGTSLHGWDIYVATCAGPVELEHIGIPELWGGDGDEKATRKIVGAKVAEYARLIEGSVTPTGGVA